MTAVAMANVTTWPRELPFISTRKSDVSVLLALQDVTAAHLFVTSIAEHTANVCMKMASLFANVKTLTPVSLVQKLRVTTIAAITASASTSNVNVTDCGPVFTVRKSYAPVSAYLTVSATRKRILQCTNQKNQRVVHVTKAGTVQAARWRTNVAKSA